jgi:hypothetical protein
MQLGIPGQCPDIILRERPNREVLAISQVTGRPEVILSGARKVGFSVNRPFCLDRRVDREATPCGAGPLISDPGKKPSNRYINPRSRPASGRCLCKGRLRYSVPCHCDHADVVLLPEALRGIGHINGGPCRPQQFVNPIEAEQLPRPRATFAICRRENGSPICSA